MNMEALKDASHLYEVERRVRYAERPDFRIQELQLSTTQKVPWHYHNNVQDTFYVLKGNLRLFLRDPKEEVRLGPGDSYTVKPPRPHLVANGGDASISATLRPSSFASASRVASSRARPRLSAASSARPAMGFHSDGGGEAGSGMAHCSGPRRRTAGRKARGPAGSAGPPRTPRTSARTGTPARSVARRRACDSG